jgi:hypothetical protein
VRPIAKLAVSGALVLGLVTTTWREAHAANTRVVVLGSKSDPIAVRLQKELVAMGFDAGRVDGASECSYDAVAAWVDEMHAAGAACSNGASVAVWVVTRSGLRLADMVTPREGDDAAPDLIAVRAAEITRATLELPSNDPPDAAPLPASASASKPPPTWTTDVPFPEIDGGLHRPNPVAVPAPRMNRATVAAGVSALMGADVTAAAFDMELDVRVVRSLGIATRMAVVPSAPTIAAGRRNVTVSPNLFGIGPLFALAPLESFVVPRLGAGVGFVWLRTNAAFANSGSEGNQGEIGSVLKSDSIVSPMFYANAAMSLRVTGPLRLAFDGMLGTTGHRMVVRSEGQHAAYWGQPFGSLAARVELAFR